MKNAGKLFREKRADFENFMSTVEQNNLQSMYFGSNIYFNTHSIDKELVTVYQVIPDNEVSSYKVKEDIQNNTIYVVRP
jgi:hypothetical protein